MIKAILLTAAAVWIGLSLSVIVGLAKDGVPSSRLNSTGANTSQAPRPPLVSQDKAKPRPAVGYFRFKLVAVKTIPTEMKKK